MSQEQLKAFLAKVKGDSNLQEKLKTAKSPEDVVGIAKEYGHDFAAFTDNAADACVMRATASFSPCSSVHCP